MITSRTGAPIQSVDEWFQLAPPRGGRFQWRDGRSAKELAKAWCGPNGPATPPAVRALLDQHVAFAGTQLVQVFPEHRIRFDGLQGEPRNSDLAGYGDGPAGRVALSVEAKADEPFGPPVSRYILDAALEFAEESRSGQLQRIQDLARALFARRRSGLPKLGELRYQLLTAAAGALAYAQSVNATIALLLFHEFHDDDVRPERLIDNQRDLNNFIARFTNGAELALPAGTIIGPYLVPGNESIPADTPLFFGRITTPVHPANPGVDGVFAQ